ncbi:adenosylcobalamin-dependent putative ribonucleoside-diphosphate reductase [Candidatus Arthromitus sp. SFB-4]|nr:adenosylcobalamin-dependent putative ribonucleoside-diphosphate reductase [Candidatus Arthromitus sp. SFB-4]
MGLLNSLSKSLSVMLQHKVSPQDISSMLRGQKYEPHGFVKKHPYIKHASSISDLISKIIDIELNDYRFCQVKPSDYPNDNHTDESLNSEFKLDSSDYKKIYNKICSNCSSVKMFKNGTCYVCSDCGSTTGCS